MSMPHVTSFLSERSIQGWVGWVVVTMDKMTTHGRFREATMARANDVFPDPELPATPIILAFPHGGE